MTFRETKEVLAIMHRLANIDGQQLGIFVRSGLRKYLKTRRTDLTDEEKKVLGVNGETH